MSCLPTIAGPIALSILIFRNNFIGRELSGASGYDREKLLALQFCAKLLELLMNWSLSTIIFSFIRHEIGHGKSVPLASFVAGLQFSQIMFLFSKEFWAIVKGQFSSMLKKFAFIFLIVLCAFLSISIAPATASSIVPLFDWWPAGGTDIWLNATEAEMFPPVLNESHTLGTICAISGHKYCPSAYWQSINNGFVSLLPGSSQIVDGVQQNRPPTRMLITGRRAILNIRVDVREPFYDVFSPNFSVATAPHIAVADPLILAGIHWDMAAKMSTSNKETNLWYYSQASYKLSSLSPITHTRCQMSIRLIDSTYPPTFPSLMHSDLRDVNITNSEIDRWMSSVLSNISRPDIFWFNPDSQMAKNASLGALIAVPTDSQSSVQVFGCLIDARWADARLSGDRVSLVVAGQPRSFRPVSKDGTTVKTWIGDSNYGTRVRIQPSYAQYLNPRTPEKNWTVLQEMAYMSELWVPGAAGSSSSPHLETILNLMVVNGMARTAPYTTNLARLKDADGAWWRGFMPKDGKPLGLGGNAYLVTPEQQATFYKLHMDAEVQGYAYTAKSRDVLLSLTIQYAYVMLAFIFILYTAISRKTSSAWDSAAELIAIALKSSPPPQSKLSGVSAGFSQLQPLKENYCIVVKGDELEMQLVEGKEPIINKVEPNVRYI